MASLNILTHCGIDYFDPSDVRAAKKEQYWRATGNVMASAGIRLAQDLPPADAAKAAFYALQAEQQQDVLLQQRHYLAQTCQRNMTPDASEKDPGSTFAPLSWPFINGAFQKLHHGRQAIQDRNRTAVSYTKPHISEIFAEGDRVYLPLRQFIPKSRDMDKGRNLEKHHGRQMMVLSRHPYDLVRMSTGRLWESCMSHDGMNFSRYVAQDIAQGSLIAYAVNDGDDDANDWNIDCPSSRCLFKPCTALGNDKTVIYQRDTIYGRYNEPFKLAANEVTRQWLNREGQVDADYRLNKGLYSGSIYPEITFAARDKAAHPVKTQTLLKEFADNGLACLETIKSRCIEAWRNLSL